MFGYDSLMDAQFGATRMALACLFPDAEDNFVTRAYLAPPNGDPTCPSQVIRRNMRLKFWQDILNYSYEAALLGMSADLAWALVRSAKFPEDQVNGE